MKKASKEEFYKEICCRDIVLKAVGDKYPFTTEFKTRNGILVGKSFEGEYLMSDYIYEIKKPI